MWTTFVPSESILEIGTYVYALVPGWTAAGESRDADMGQVVIYPQVTADVASLL